MAVQQPGKLLNLFKDQPLAEHGRRWDSLWQEDHTPWDRAEPSMALRDLLADRPDLVPPASGGHARPRALVPGCGRGYDVLLLAAFGYDAYGVDYSAKATKEAARYQDKVYAEGDERYRPRDGLVRGTVKWWVAPVSPPCSCAAPGVNHGRPSGRRITPSCVCRVLTLP